MATIKTQRQAALDLDAIMNYLEENAGEIVADRFLEKAERTFAVLAENPNIGKITSLKGRPKVAGLRKFPIPIRGFKYLIFYMPRQNGISVVRVIHSSQDWWEK